jgi:hypothetical protein
VRSMEESGGLEVSIATTTSARVEFGDHALAVENALIGARSLAIFDYADCTGRLNRLPGARPR